MKSVKNNIIWVGLIMVFLLAACKKNDDYTPYEGQIGYINFYNAADGLMQNGLFSGMHHIYINDMLSKNRHPQFLGGNSFNQYPRSATGSDLIADGPTVPGDVNYQVVFWLPLKADDYRFYYTSISADNSIKKGIINTNTAIEKGSFTMQYLMESMQTDTSYQIITVPVERKGSNGKVRVQVLNLSPDMGSLQVYRENENGTIINDGLPTALATGAYSAYVEIDTIGAHKNLDQLSLKFRKPGDSKALFTVSFPAIAKSSFSIVVQGFAAQANRRIKSIQSNAGGFVPVIVEPNLRVNVRRTY